MTELAAIINHGDFSQPYLAEAPRWSIRTDGLDTLSLRMYAPTENAFLRGQPLTGDYAGMYVADFDREQDGDEWLFSIEAEGVKGGSGFRIIGNPQPQTVLGDWDTVQMEVLTTLPSLYTAGQYLAGQWTAMVCTSCVPKWERGPWFRLMVSGAGIARSKTPVREITCNGQSISADSVKWNLPGGWNTYQKGVVDLPQIQVKDTYWQLSAPPSGSVPGSATPPNTPPTRDLGPLTSSSSVKYWPNGWKFTCNGRQLGTSALWANDYIYTLQWKDLPG